ncbi:alpha-ketoglutarate-dependent dioxygenase AlkB family protein [Acinetobacter schindleri]|uniref:alpha-ketoglutarate-dependent dioxygenase AlkB family protein n=1 Tax=Acinetobacter schindleri TaxID=108981 RepID=UPI003F576365
MTLDLFSPQSQTNLLPCDGVVEDHGLILNGEQSQKYLDYFLQHLAWEQDEVFLFGKHHVTARKIAWYGDANYQYHYSGSLKKAHIWQPALLRLKQHIEQRVGHPFNSCLANLYEHGQQGMGWHSDNEASLMLKRHETVIASLSFGATRKMRFKHNYTGNLVELLLQSGQLIVMRGQTQQFWKHQISKTTKVITPRINLTFRYFYPEN